MPNVVDAVVALFVLLGAWNGYRAGLLIELAGLARLAAAIIAAVRYFPLPAGWIVRAFGLPLPIANIAGFLAVFGAVELALGLLYGVTVYRLADALHLTPGVGGLDRLLGMLPAAAQAVVWAALGLTALLLLPISPPAQGLITDSLLGNALVVGLADYEPRLQNSLGNAARDSLLLLTPPATPAEGTVQLHIPPDLRLSTDSAAEATMLAYVNAQRTQRSLPPLRLDPALSAVAREHSVDMFQRSYFSHDTPEGLTPFQRMRAAGIRYAVAGENIAYAPNVTIADTGLMNSPEHRENILRPEFSRIGVGVVSGGFFQEMFTQDFAD